MLADVAYHHRKWEPLDSGHVKGYFGCQQQMVAGYVILLTFNNHKAV